jgi:hypothetical protein
MSCRSVISMLGAAALLAASVAGASSASALPLDATAPPHDFGNVTVYSTVRESVTVTASGGDVTFGSVPTIEPVNDNLDQAADYSVVDRTCLDTVSSGTTCTVTVEFTPFAVGLRKANLSIVTTSPAATVLVELSGTGAPDATGTYYGLSTPTRFLDTRQVGTRLPLAAGSITELKIGGVSEIPATGVSAAVINLTAVATSTPGYFTMYPSDKARPTASTINFPKGWTGANMATVPLGADGKVKLYNYGGKAHAVVDVLGWYAKDDTVRAANGMGAQFQPTTETGDPTRIYDSRDDPVNSNLPFLGGDWIEFDDNWGDSEASATGVKAYAVNITAVNATGSGYLTAWAGGGSPRPVASTVNYVKGTIAPNMTVVPARYFPVQDPDTGDVTHHTGFRIQDIGSGEVHIIVDVTGYYVADESAGMRFKPLTTVESPKRILDTRTGTGLSGPFGSGQTRTAPATNVASADSIYLVGNTTGDKPTVRTYLTVWSGASARPKSSNLNVNAGLTRAVATYAPLRYNSTTGASTYNVYNHAGSMRVIFDAAGTLDLYPGGTTATVTGSTGLASAADRTVAGRTIPGASTFATGHEGTTHRRG